MDVPLPKSLHHLDLTAKNISIYNVWFVKNEIVKPFEEDEST